VPNTQGGPSKWVGLEFIISLPKEQGAKLIFFLDLLCEKQESGWKHF
jgi:hypothetical protein